MIKRVCSILALIFLCTTNAQSFKMEVTVVDKKGAPVRNVLASTLHSKKTFKLSDYRGKFKIKTAVGDTLFLVNSEEELFKVAVSNTRNKILVLTESDSIINTSGEVVHMVRIASTQSHKELLNKFQKINKNVFYNSVFDRLRADYPELEIDESSGKITIRGINSTGNHQPALIIVDGVKGMDYKNLNPNDILRIKVIKDGTAGMYGGRASGGVIEFITK